MAVRTALISVDAVDTAAIVCRHVLQVQRVVIWSRDAAAMIVSRMHCGCNDDGRLHVDKASVSLCLVVAAMIAACLITKQ